MLPTPTKENTKRKEKGLSFNVGCQAATGRIFLTSFWKKATLNGN